MKVKFMNKSRWDHPGDFPTFKMGTHLQLENEEDINFIGWYACEITGFNTYVPKIFVKEGKLTRDYNPTELIPEIGDILEVKEIVYAWLIVKNEKGIIGWVPAECVVSINE